MGLVLLRKGSQCFIGLVFTPFDPPACVINSQKKMSVIVNNCKREVNMQQIRAIFNNKSSNNNLWSVLLVVQWK